MPLVLLGVGLVLGGCESDTGKGEWVTLPPSCPSGRSAIAGKAQHLLPWEDRLLMEMALLEERQMTGSYDVDAGHLWLPVTVPMATIFDTIPKRQVIAFLEQASVNDIRFRGSINQQYIEECVDAVRDNLKRSHPVAITGSTGGSGRFAMDVVYYWIPLE